MPFQLSGQLTGETENKLVELQRQIIIINLTPQVRLKESGHTYFRPTDQNIEYPVSRHIFLNDRRTEKGIKNLN